MLKKVEDKNDGILLLEELIIRYKKPKAGFCRI